MENQGFIFSGGYSKVSSEKYSGRFVIRMPKTLHAKFAIKAAQKGVSLSQYSLYRLSM
jgi:predicted HicB family RNase H-like nuclease